MSCRSTSGPSWWGCSSWGGWAGSRSGLGADSIAAGKIATYVAGVFVILFMFATYGTFGFFANIAGTRREGIEAGSRATLGPADLFANYAWLNQESDADALVLDVADPQFAGVRDEDALDRWIFAGNRNLVRETTVAGRRLVADGRHVAAESIAAGYRSAIGELLRD